jgi:hypothetical protein
MARKLFRNCDPPTWTTVDDPGATASWDDPVLTVSMPADALRLPRMERITNCTDCGGLAFEAGTYDETHFLVSVELRTPGSPVPFVYEEIGSGMTVVLEVLPPGNELRVTVRALSDTGPAGTITVEVSRF